MTIEFNIQIPVLFSVYFKCVRSNTFPPGVSRLMIRLNYSTYSSLQSFTASCANILSAVCMCDLVSIYRLEHWWYTKNGGLYWNQRYLFYLPVVFPPEWSAFLRHVFEFKWANRGGVNITMTIAKFAQLLLGHHIPENKLFAWHLLIDYVERRILSHSLSPYNNMYSSIGLFSIYQSDGTVIKGM